MACRGFCAQFRAVAASGGLHYLAGQKRCQYCDIYMEIAGNMCPCCHHRLRLSPRGSKHKQRFLTTKRLQRNL